MVLFFIETIIKVYKFSLDFKSCLATFLLFERKIGSLGMLFRIPPGHIVVSEILFAKCYGFSWSFSGYAKYQERSVVLYSTVQSMTVFHLVLWVIRKFIWSIEILTVYLLLQKWTEHFQLVQYLTHSGVNHAQYIQTRQLQPVFHWFSGFVKLYKKCSGMWYFANIPNFSQFYQISLISVYLSGLTYPLRVFWGSNFLVGFIFTLRSLPPSHDRNTIRQLLYSPVGVGVYFRLASVAWPPLRSRANSSRIYHG